MVDGFRPLGTILRERTVVELVQAPVVAASAELSPQRAPPEPAHVVQPLAVLFDEIALARVAALEAYERGVDQLLSALAHDVLARELALAPVDVAALSRLLIARFADEEPVELRVAPEDAPGLACAVAVRVDDSLAAGDVVLAVRDGTIDARFALRVRAALRESVG